MKEELALPVLRGADGEYKAGGKPALPTLTEPLYSVPATIKAFLSGKANAQGVKPGPIKATVGLVTFQVMTPGGVHDVNASITAIRLPDKIEADGTKRQQVTYDLRFGAIGFDAEQMVPHDKTAHAQWRDTLIDGFRAWRKAKGINPPALVVGGTAAVYDE